MHCWLEAFWFMACISHPFVTTLYLLEGKHMPSSSLNLSAYGYEEGKRMACNNTKEIWILIWTRVMNQIQVPIKLAPSKLYFFFFKYNIQTQSLNTERKEITFVFRITLLWCASMNPSEFHDKWRSSDREGTTAHSTVISQMCPHVLVNIRKFKFLNHNLSYPQKI